MNVTKIFTERSLNVIPSWDLVFEWEDVLKEHFKADFFCNSEFLNKKYIKWLPLPQIGELITKGELCFRYELYSKLRNGIWNNKNIIPCIIDFYVYKKELAKFEAAYCNNKLVLISSREVYDFLKQNGCRLNVEHLALSLSDKYRITPETRFEKKYELVLVGRQNPVLMGFLQKYHEQHPDFSYVYRTDNNGKFAYYTCNGVLVGDFKDRNSYVKLMRSARIGLYSTPGTDDAKGITKGFSQVTPRLLELMAAGCHVIARYIKNSDTDYYELDKFCPSIETYEQFESAMDKARTTDVDTKMYSDYLKKHYTSVRAEQLKEILKTI